jgi:hypothetical protein
LPEGRRGAVDVGAGTAGAVDHAAQQAGIGIEVVGRSQASSGPCRRTSNSAEISARSVPLRTTRGIGPFAQRQRQRIDQDRLAGAGLAGQGAEAGAELEFERSTMTKSRMIRRSSMVQCRGVELQCSFSRSMAK